MNIFSSSHWKDKRLHTNRDNWEGGRGQTRRGKPSLNWALDMHLLNNIGSYKFSVH